MNRTLFIFFLVIANTFSAFATPKKLSVPRYVTIKFDEVNARTGPTEDCPIEWVFIKKDEPVEIIAEYDQWRKIRDINGEGGWVHSRVISGNRTVIFVAKNTMPLVAAPGKYDQVIAKLAPQIRCSLYSCEKDWCKVNCKSYKGWIARKFLWGVYPDE